ncbi:MAG TPA: thiamine pyrophosphate-dependent enzyme [Syntrophomonadaceae bacterium]|nr:pyruvate synthase subunit beta [Syntrophomonadaceae bacterium]HOQ10470.1 thiamine pyrophosphate-dependent enzyme [Syntrophomonadaceae bacterium]HPU49613.1 thiamine pyrophosphate-dependent enzyme [Syntrophomonadaceae bacterium]
MATSIKNLPDNEQVLSGNGACGGCPATMALRMVGKALGPNAIMLLTPSCSVASMGMTPKLGYNWPCINVCFATAGSSASGITHALEIMQEKGRLKGELPTVFCWVGDGGTYDIGFQALSAAAERNDNMIFFCYNNEAYSNTGVQRSGATPRGSFTTTTPRGKRQPKKNMALLMLEHHIPYVATATVAYPGDLYDKVVKAKSIEGLKYIEILAPCYLGWQFDMPETVQMSRMAVRCGAWLLWEAENGKITFNNPTSAIISGKKAPEPVNDYLFKQGRFKRLLQGPDADERIAEIQGDIDREIAFMRERAKIVI